MRKPNQMPCLGEHPCEWDTSVSAKTTGSVQRKRSSVVVGCRPTFSRRHYRRGQAPPPVSTATPNRKCVRTTGDWLVSSKPFQPERFRASGFCRAPAEWRQPRADSETYAAASRASSDHEQTNANRNNRRTTDEVRSEFAHRADC